MEVIRDIANNLMGYADIPTIIVGLIVLYFIWRVYRKIAYYLFILFTVANLIRWSAIFF
ncbi:hypothetical protein J2S74_002920 [Evansella vedderi]|uniref:TIGR00159 family protein n=1 Tax=Evansella vedderi TaxID=38282 RepID=A0ABT9ZWC7_9BACI|nr:hypothetical protein [Evansella vedderi]MDQ0255538.1 hypothetical protein [Evansella vedderi]